MNKKKIFITFLTIVLLVSTTKVLALSKTTVKATTNRYQETKISWTKVSGAKKYRVYRCNSKGKNCKSIKTTIYRKYTDKKGKEGTTYIYKVRAYKGSTSSLSNGVKGLKLYDGISYSVSNSAYNTNTISINKLATAKYYYIYRATSKYGKYTKIATIKNNGSPIKYYDKNVSFNKKYYYKIRVGNAINYGAYSSKKYVVTKNIAKPGIKAQVVAMKINLSNYKVTGASGYDIYYSTDNKKFTKLVRTTSTSYSKELSAKTYYVKIRAYRKVGSNYYYSGYSNTVNFIIVQMSKDNAKAVENANKYANTLHLSKKAITNKLISDNFYQSAIDYALSHITVNYNNNALERAKYYSSNFNMSKNGIYAQLLIGFGEGFTESEALYAINNLNVNYNESALKYATNAYKNKNLSRYEIYKDLVNEEKYTDSEAKYAINKLDFNFKNIVSYSINKAINDNYYSKQGLIKYLVDFELYTEEEAIYGVDNSSIDFKLNALNEAKEYYELVQENELDESMIKETLEKSLYTEDEIEYALSNMDK